MNDPRLFSKLDADRILKRAAEIEGSEDPKPLSVEELRAIANEAGFGSRAIDRAIAETLNSDPTGSRHQPVRKSGLIVTYLSTVRSIPIDLTSDQLLRAVRLFQPYREGPATIHLGEHQITWRDERGLKFTVMSGSGSTEIRVFVSKILLKKGRWMGWVKSAADRLEALVLMVGTRGLAGQSDLDAKLLAAKATADGA